MEEKTQFVELLKKKIKAQNENNKTLLETACINLAELYFREGRFQSTIDEYKVLSTIYKEQDKILDYARANRMIGEAYTQLQQYNKALEYHDIYLSVAKRQGDKLEEQRALATIGHTYLTSCLNSENPQKKNLSLASKAFIKSLRICESLSHIISKREQMDMMARLLANLGTVYECEGSIEKGIEYINRSINLCKSNDIFEQLERDYVIMGSLHAKKQDYSNAIHFYNSAIEVAGRLEDKVSLICLSLFSKAEVLIKLADFHGAKTILHKAYKMRTPNKSERENIEHTLKVVVSMCYTEDALIVASDTDYNTKKKLYEKMGDGATYLKNYPKAIEYYKKMLECAEKNGDRGRDISPCYVSLAQTYKDNYNYDLAIEYFQKDYDICAGNLNEGISSLFALIDAMEIAGKKVDDIIIVFNQAISNCRDSHDNIFEAKTLSKLLEFLKRHNRDDEADNYQMMLDKLDVIDDESEDEQISPSIGDEIDLDDITDTSDDDSKNENHKRNSRRRSKGFAFKRNEKGETPLHTACIKGNELLVSKLLDQGHVVNVRDNAGWLPIHEACIHGHLGIVKLLVQKGANINDRGGSSCNGMTPLHDACSNGHLEVIEYLLQEGALAIAKTDEGVVPLHILKTWRKNVVLDPINQTFYESLMKKIQSALDKAGQTSAEVIISKENSVLVVEDEVAASQSQSVIPQTKKRQIGDLRKNARKDIFLHLEYSDDNNETEATDDYKSAIENLRKPPSQKSPTKVNLSIKKSALFNENDVGDDWLEDDLKTNNKKRKAENFFTTGTNLKHSFKENIQTSDDDFDHKGKKKKQTTLIKSGFSRNRSSSCHKMNPILATRKSDSPKLTQSKINNFMNENDDSDLSFTPINNVTLTPPVNGWSQNSNNIVCNIDVRIEDKLFKIPIPHNELGTLTIKWLADVAIKRYYTIAGMKPIVDLETTNGAILSEDDYVNILFPLGGLRGDEVKARVIRWNTPPLNERYKDACNLLNTEVDEQLLESLKMMSITLNISDKNLQNKSIPLCKALNRHTNLHELNLGGNYIGDNCVEVLCDSFPTLDNLSILYLNNNHLTSLALQHIAKTLTLHKGAILNSLKTLDLSFNPLKNKSLQYLAIITKHLKLKTLALESVEFDNDIFKGNGYILLSCEFIEVLNISGNEMSKNDVLKFISWLQPMNVKELNLRRNGRKNGFLENCLGVAIVEFLLTNTIQFFNLQTLNLSRCNISDEDIPSILKIMSIASKFQSLNLSFSKISGLSLKQLLETGKLEQLDVSCCDNLLNNFDNCSFPWNLLSCKILYSSFDLIINCYVCDSLTEMWKSKFNGNFKIRNRRRMFHLIAVNL